MNDNNMFFDLASSVNKDKSLFFDNHVTRNNNSFKYNRFNILFDEKHAHSNNLSFSGSLSGLDSNKRYQKYIDSK